ncbi:MAG: exodeoxyribonuclease VII large subunit [Holosporales bacterium]
MAKEFSALDENKATLPILSVSEFSLALKRVVETQFSFIRLRGEISGGKRHTSGHYYFALKDQDAVMDAVCWRGSMGSLGFTPADGLEVIATGRLSTYPGRSKYQMIVEHMEPAGEGALLKLLEERKRMLAAEGLFALERKKPLPFLPQVIGIITSPTGAVIRDILHRLSERFPRHVLLWPVLVQGEGAAAQIAAAIRGFNALPKGGEVPRPDLLIVARGGGSLEDLWAFNEEIVVRATAASDIPLISAVGHETDTTLIDYASDLRAPTPTAAAERAVPVRADLVQRTQELKQRLLQGLYRHHETQRLRFTSLAARLIRPDQLLDQLRLRLDERGERHHRAMAIYLQRLQQHLGHMGKMLETSAYHTTLARGFSVITDGSGKPLTSIHDFTHGEMVKITVQDGNCPARIEKQGAVSNKPLKSKKTQLSSPSYQGHLWE